MLPNCGGARRLCQGGATRPGEAGGRGVESSPQGVGVAGRPSGSAHVERQTTRFFGRNEPHAGRVSALALDGPERRRQRPTDPAQQQAHYSGKKKTHTDKNLLLVNEHTGKVVYLGPTIAGKIHDKKAADAAQIAYPVNATLDKDTGFQGYEPAGVLTQQPKKNQKGRY